MTGTPRLPLSPTVSHLLILRVSTPLALSSLSPPPGHPRLGCPPSELFRVVTATVLPHGTECVCSVPKGSFRGLVHSGGGGGGAPTKRLLEPRSPLVRPLEKQAIQRLFTAKPRKVLARQVSPASEMNPLSSGAFALPRDPDGAHQTPGCPWASELISSCWKFLCSLPSDRHSHVGPRAARGSLTDSLQPGSLNPNPPRGRGAGPSPQCPERPVRGTWFPSPPHPPF